MRLPNSGARADSIARKGPRVFAGKTLNSPGRVVFVFDLVVHTLDTHMHPSARSSVFAASLLGFTGVALGAFGAHALRDMLTANGTLPVWQTAVLYQLVHATALLGLAGWSAGWPKARWAARCWIAGVVLFSGSLYGLALGGPKILGPVTPLGGLALLTGWLLLGWSAFPPAKI